MNAQRFIVAAVLAASSSAFFACKGKHSPPPSESSLKRQQNETNDPTEELAGGKHDTKGQPHEPQRVAKPTDDLADDKHQDDVPRPSSEQRRAPRRVEEEE